MRERGLRARQAAPLSPDQAPGSRDTTWRYQKVREMVRGCCIAVHRVGRGCTIVTCPCTILSNWLFGCTAEHLAEDLRECHVSRVWTHVLLFVTPLILRQSNEAVTRELERSAVFRYLPPTDD